MILLYEIQPKIFKLIEELNKKIKENQKVKSHIYIHGSSGKPVGEYSMKYVTDIDTEFWIQYQNNRNDIYKHCINTVNYLMTIGFYYNKLRFGQDPRFTFTFKIKKNTSIIGYDYNEIKTRFNELLTTHVIDKKEYKYLMEYADEIPTFIRFEKFKLRLDEFKVIVWNLEEFKKGKMKYRGKEIKIEELFMNDVMLFAFVYEMDNSKNNNSKNNNSKNNNSKIYLNFDISIKIFKLNNKNLNSNLNLNKNYVFESSSDAYRILTTVSKLCNIDEDISNFHYYEGIFKNYSQQKYLKVLKRLKSLLSTFMWLDKSHLLNTQNKYLQHPKYRNIYYKLKKKKIGRASCRERV